MAAGVCVGHSSLTHTELDDRGWLVGCRSGKPAGLSVCHSFLFSRGKVPREIEEFFLFSFPPSSPFPLPQKTLHTFSRQPPPPPPPTSGGGGSRVGGSNLSKSWWRTSHRHHLFFSLWLLPVTHLPGILMVHRREQSHGDRISRMLLLGSDACT